MVKPPIIGYDHCTPISPPTIQFHRKTQVVKDNYLAKLKPGSGGWNVMLAQSWA
jgi:hypothetical protein